MNTAFSVRYPLLAVILLVTTVACGGGESTYIPAPRADLYRGTQAPGDVWTYTLGSTTFTAANETLGHDYAGSLTALDNGYLKLTVTSSDDPGLVGQLPLPAYALEVPGVALVIKPVDADGNVIVCVAVDANPDEETIYNYVKFPDPDWGTGVGGIDDEEVWGRATSFISGSDNDEFDFWIEFWWMANASSVPTQTEWAGESFVGVDGWLVPDAGDQRLGITPPGLFVQDSGPNSGGAMGVEAPALPLGLDALFGADHDFLGYVFQFDQGGDNTKAVWATATDGDDRLSVGHVATTTGSFDAATPQPEEARITLAAETTNGVYRGALVEPGPDGLLGTADDVETDLVLLCGYVAGRYFVFGLVEPNGTLAATNVILIEQ